MAEARAVKFCTQMGYVKSYQNNKKHPQKGRGYGHVTYLNSHSNKVDWSGKTLIF